MKKVDYEVATKAFITGMTNTQLENLIRAFLERVSDEDFSRICAGMKDEKEITNLREAVLNPQTLDKKQTEQKITKKWNNLESEIDDILFEVGDEDGEYVEEDYGRLDFNAYALASDFDKIFEKMIPLLEKAWNLELADTEFFTDIIKDTREGINSYPEWIGAEYSDFVFGEHFSECLLTWAWLTKESIEEFVENSLKIFEDEYLTCDFETNFLENASKKDLTDLNETLLRKAKMNSYLHLDDPHSFWNSLKLMSEKAVNPDSYYKSLDNSIDVKWFRGIDLYRKFADAEDYLNAERCCVRTLGQAYRQQFHQNFDTNPEHTLFAAHSTPKDQRIRGLYDDWVKYSQKSGLSSRFKLASLQRAFFLAPEDFASSVNDLIMAKNEGWRPAITNEWKLYVVRKTLNHHFYSASSDCWIGWLIDFALNGDSTLALEKINAWLASKFEEPSGWGHGVDFSLLYQLSKIHLKESNSLNDYPRLQEYIFKNDSNKIHCFDEQTTNERVTIDVFLKELLMKVNLSDEKVLSAWKSNIRSFIQSPDEVSGARYESPAKWLAIARELNNKVYKSVLENWRTKQWRKRNLWSALAQYDIHK